MIPCSLRIPLLLLLLFAQPAMAHELRPGYLEISESSPNQYDIVWKAPIIMGRPLAVEPSYPENCELEHSIKRSTIRNAVISHMTLACSEPLHGQRIDLNGLDKTQTDVLIRLQTQGGELQALRATPDATFVVIASSLSTQSVMSTYFVLGVEHIALGIDHLLFVLALVLLIRGARRLIATVTAFTVAHSITLITASLGWVQLPARPVEAVIALSIVFLAVEVANKQDGSLRQSERWPWLVAFIFGLLHGFGFAGALAEIGLPKNDVPAALLMFNLGVEAGQLVFVGAALVVLAAVSRLRLRKHVDTLASYAIGITASVWLFERVML